MGDEEENQKVLAITDSTDNQAPLAICKCTMQYDDKHLDKSEYQKPQSPVLIRIRCPGPECPSTIKDLRVCKKCEVLLEYFEDYIYCNCGRCDYRHWFFRCSNQKMTTYLARYDAPVIRALLKELDHIEEMNILLLGRTGVGKSTWVNAFVNYLKFPTLEDALEDAKLVYRVPFAFSISSTDDQGEFVDIDVKFGSSSTEKDGTSGESATQVPVEYRVLSENRVVRLIDTPGIGDTKGADYDKKNMANLLNVLRSYKQLHGALILLAPNDQRLDVVFRFCIQELLTHLHRDAAENMAFGFTNSRGTHYNPGDTMVPLSELLKQINKANPDIEIRLHKNNVYCFDSESFRCLAAKKQGRSLGNLSDNHQSWNHSAAECRRLMSRFEKLTPHDVTSTVNLYETRRRIARMAEPMAALQGRIDGTLKFNEEQIGELSAKELKWSELKRFLKVQVKTLNVVNSVAPRTTCTHQDCVEHKNTGQIGADGKPIFKTIHKSACHANCRLHGVPVDDVGNPILKHCWAMNRTETCRICSHNWMAHLHVLYTLDEGTEEKDDPDIQEKLKQNATSRDLQQALIASKKNLIEELKGEMKQIQDATVQFSIFLKRNAILTYNDATLEYLDLNLQDERSKVMNGGSRDKLDRLTQYRNQYEQEVKIHSTNQEIGGNEKPLDREGANKMAADLHRLKHYGPKLKELSAVAVKNDSSRQIVKVGGP